jgi:hypothetical protein
MLTSVSFAIKYDLFICISVLEAVVLVSRSTPFYFVLAVVLALDKNIPYHACHQHGLHMPLVDITQLNQPIVLFSGCCFLCQFHVPAAGMAGMVSHVLSVARAPTAPPCTILIISMYVTIAL